MFCLMELNLESNTHKLKPFPGYGQVNYTWNGVVFPILGMIEVFGMVKGLRYNHGHFHVLPA